MELILKYFPDLTMDQKSKIGLLKDLYVEWNSKINVISRKDMDSFYERHVLHSLGIAKVYSFVPGQRILDIGTGGGFPGIPLAILFPETDFLLVDSIGKKIKVVKEVARALALKNVEAEHARAEEISGQFDFIISRAVTQLPKFLPWTKGKIKGAKKDPKKLKNGILYLKGGDLAEELKGIKQFKIFELSSFFEEDFFETKKVLHL
jgi:16S rRNA (guanine527-N7)-methyltransferase